MVACAVAPETTIPDPDGMSPCLKENPAVKGRLPLALEMRVTWGLPATGAAGASPTTIERTFEVTSVPPMVAEAWGVRVPALVAVAELVFTRSPGATVTDEGLRVAEGPETRAMVTETELVTLVAVRVTVSPIETVAAPSLERVSVGACVEERMPPRVRIGSMV